MEIMPDHVHLLVDAPPNLAPDQIMFRLKGFTSFQLRKEYPHLKKFLLFGLEAIFVVRSATLLRKLLKNILKTKILEGG
jgi:REP element-mobilizing transposase RayT